MGACSVDGSSLRFTLRVTTTVCCALDGSACPSTARQVHTPVTVPPRPHEVTPPGCADGWIARLLLDGQLIPFFQGISERQ